MGLLLRLQCMRVSYEWEEEEGEEECEGQRIQLL